MNTDEILRPLVADSAGSLPPVVICPPAPGWRHVVGHIVRRSTSRRQARRIVGGRRELVIWGASPGLRPWLPSLRQALLGGSLVVDVVDQAPLRFAYRETGFEPTDHLRVGSGGGLRQFGKIVNTNAVLRLGTISASGDPGWHYQALSSLDHPSVPPALGTGSSGEVRWTVEGHLAGKRIDTPSPALIEQVDRFLAGLPRHEGPITVVASGGSELTDSRILEAGSHIAATIDSELGDLPAVTIHGDLWAGNLLFQEGRLTAVLDWDSWQERGVPGSDLLHFFAEHIRRRAGLSYGDLVAQAFWHRPEVADALQTHLERLEIDWHERLPEIVGRAWWVGTVAGALRRSPDLARNRRWITRNVIAPAQVISEQLS